MTSRHALVIAALAVSSSLAGCAGAPPPEGGYRIDGQNSVRPTLNTVRVIDDSLAQYRSRKWDVRSVLDVENVTVSETETGFKRISVELRNKSDIEIPLEVRNSWYDPAGRPVDMASSWSRVFVRPMSVALYEQIASRPIGKQATDALDTAREKMALAMFKDWTRKDFDNLARLMRMLVEAMSG